MKLYGRFYSLRRRVCFVAILAIGFSFGSGLIPHQSSKSAFAQQRNGGLLDELFRTIARSQLEREQRKRLEAERNASRNPTGLDRTRINPPGTRNPNPTRIPTTGNGSNVERRNRVDDRGNSGRTSIPVDPATYRTLQDDLNRIVSDLRRDSGRNANIRALVPDAYRLAAEAGTLADFAARTQRGRLVDAIAPFDRDYRQFSFSLRSAPGVSSNTRTLISQTDRLVNRMSRAYSVSPQWDRERFDDIALVTAVTLQTILDDLEVISFPESQRRKLSHDLRLMGQRIEVIRTHVATMTYDDAASEFNQFAAQMMQLGESLRALRNPHVNRRLDRLRGLADETYGVLWMPAPVQTSVLINTAKRLEDNAHQLRDDLNRSVTRVLDNRSQDRVDALVRTLDREAHEFFEEVQRRTTDTGAGRRLQTIDATVAELIGLTRYLAGPHHASLTAVRDDTQALLEMMQVGSSSGLVNQQNMLHVAATLEGGGEALRDAIRRVERSFRTSTYRNALRRDSDKFYREAREFHEDVDDRRDIDDLRQRIDSLLTAWQSLSRGIDVLEQNGLDSRSAAAIRTYRNELVAAVGEVAAVYGR